MTLPIQLTKEKREPNYWTNVQALFLRIVTSKIFCHLYFQKVIPTRTTVTFKGYNLVIDPHQWTEYKNVALSDSFCHRSIKKQCSMS